MLLIFIVININKRYVYIYWFCLFVHFLSISFFFFPLSIFIPRDSSIVQGFSVEICLSLIHNIIKEKMKIVCQNIFDIYIYYFFCMFFLNEFLCLKQQKKRKKRKRKLEISDKLESNLDITIAKGLAVSIVITLRLPGTAIVIQRLSLYRLEIRSL